MNRPPLGERSPRRPAIKVDLAPAAEALEDALEVVDRLEGTVTELDPPLGPGRRSNRVQAQLGQDLLRAAATARLGAALIEAEYWRIRSAPKEAGHDDRRE